MSAKPEPFLDRCPRGHPFFKVVGTAGLCPYCLSSQLDLVREAIGLVTNERDAARAALAWLLTKVPQVVLVDPRHAAAIDAAMDSKPADSTARVPIAWMRGVVSHLGPNGPDEFDAEFSYGDDRPDGDGWSALYR